MRLKTSDINSTNINIDYSSTWIETNDFSYVDTIYDY